MKQLSSKAKKWILFSVITALAIAMGCVFAACTKVGAQPPEKQESSAAEPVQKDAEYLFTSSDGDTTEENYSRWLSNHYSADVYTVEMWLSDLMGSLKLKPPATFADNFRSIFETAYQCGIIKNAQTDSYTPLTRRYVASTLVNALHYQRHRVNYAADITDDDRDMNTAVYYGYFVPDDDHLVYPDAVITQDEYRSLLEEVSRYERLNGKKILSFGDSIMYGMGNSDSGISELIAEKYGMESVECSVSGATFAEIKGRSSIPVQIQTAANAPVPVKPDIIFINGGTNDMEFANRGDIIEGFDTAKADKKTFAGGFEIAAALLQKYWKDVPVLYVRAHDMNSVDDFIEQDFGETALTIAQKWLLNTVDIYNSTDLCTEFDDMRDTYTAYRERFDGADGIHPNGFGYTKYYLPSVSEKLCEILL